MRVGRNRLRLQAGKEPLQMANEKRAVQRGIGAIALGAGDDQPFGRAGKGHVAVVRLPPELEALVQAESEAVGGELCAVDPG